MLDKPDANGNPQVRVYIFISLTDLISHDSAISMVRILALAWTAARVNWEKLWRRTTTPSRRRSPLATIHCGYTIAWGSDSLTNRQSSDLRIRSASSFTWCKCSSPFFVSIPCLSLTFSSFPAPFLHGFIISWFYFVIIYCLF